MVWWILLLGIAVLRVRAWVSPFHFTKNVPLKTTKNDERFECFHHPQERQSNEGGGLERILRQSPEFLSRLTSIPLYDSQPLAEVLVQGVCVLARIVSVQIRSSQEPKLQVQLLSSFTMNPPITPTSNLVIDVGQVITIWEDDIADEDIGNVELLLLDDALIESALDRLHRTCYHRFRVTRSQHTKKEWQDLVEKACSTSEDFERAKLVLNKLQKLGVGYTRLIDSSVVVQALFTNTKAMNQHRLTAARILLHDADCGGRFKRWPCLYVSSNTSHISILNGGWQVTDPSMRTGLEARKFAERTAMNKTRDSQNTRTLADARIVQRLECLAMGELVNTGNMKEKEMPKLELDVREVLRSMQLPLSPDGAKQALIRTGFWSDDSSKQETLGRIIQPWSQEILDAAKWYATAIEKEQWSHKERLDLTQLPCVCVDASRATFRDDAIGVRLRSSTGRFVQPEASKWEILVHVADVSDIYSTHTGEDAACLPHNVSEILRQAAVRRGSSRYDLPLGPLHLLPPVALHALAFPKDGVCRSVSIWAYIDERNGSLLDCGIERTLISSPISLSFLEATSLLKGIRNDDPVTSRIQALLIVAERHLQLWKDLRLRKDLDTRKRETRLSKRESSSATIHLSGIALRDDGSDGFRRSRGHRLVDSALQLYSFLAIKLLREQRAPYPQAIGADASRGGRVGTAPLRRYIDGQTQRQLLAVLCNYGLPMDMAECKEVSKAAVDASNSIKNVRSIQAKMNRPRR